MPDHWKGGCRSIEHLNFGLFERTVVPFNKHLSFDMHHNNIIICNDENRIRRKMWCMRIADTKWDKWTNKRNERKITKIRSTNIQQCVIGAFNCLPLQKRTTYCWRARVARVWRVWMKCRHRRGIRWQFTHVRRINQNCSYSFVDETVVRLSDDVLDSMRIAQLRCKRSSVFPSHKTKENFQHPTVVARWHILWRFVWVECANYTLVHFIDSLWFV